MFCKTSPLSLKFVVLLVPEQLFVTCFVFVVSTIISYCLIMLYYSFSVAVVVVVFSRAQFTVQARDRTLSLSLLFSLRSEMGLFTLSVCLCVCLILSSNLSLLHFLIFTSSLARSFARALALINLLHYSTAG